MTFPVRSTTLAIEYGAQWTPRFARVEYAEVISSGETGEVPSVSEQNGFRGLVMPMACATSTTLWGPMSRISWANTTLMEPAVACHRFM